MRWLLDTNVLSEGIRSRPDPAVFNWMSSRKTQDVAISIVSVAELLAGAASALDRERRERLTQWIETEILSAVNRRVLPVTTEVLVVWLQLSRALRARGAPRDPADLLIAATARVHGITLATRNTRHFALTGIAVYNPWTDETQQMEAP